MSTNAHLQDGDAEAAVTIIRWSCGGCFLTFVLSLAAILLAVYWITH